MLQREAEKDRQAMRYQDPADLSCRKTFCGDHYFAVARRTHRNREPDSWIYEHQDHADIRPDYQPEDKPGYGNPFA